MSDDAISGEFGDLPFPRTAVAEAATRFARAAEHPAIFHHSLRTYRYGRAAGQRRGIEPGRDYDDELLFLGCVLHDIGLTDAGDGDQRFELDGADLARRVVVDNGVTDERADVVWDAIALHTVPDVVARKRPEIALVSLGASVDLGFVRDALPPGHADGVERALPRLHAAAVLHDVLVGQAAGRPEKAPPITLPGYLVAQHTGAVWPTWRRLVDARDYEGY